MKQKRINLKVKHLDKNMTVFFNHDIKHQHRFEEISPVYFKENYYLLNNDKCWFEIKSNGKFRAFKYKKENFYMNLKEHECLRYRKRVVDLIKELLKIEPSIFKHNLIKLVNDYDIEKNIIKYRREHIDVYFLRHNKKIKGN